MIPTQIILHHSLTKDSDTVSWGAIRRYHIDVMGWRDIGYHVGIESIDGRHEALIGRPFNIQGAHTRHQNYNSVGVCFVGNFDANEVPQEQWLLGVNIIRSLCHILNIPADMVKGHREYAGYKSCPGNKFDLDLFRDAIRRP